MNTPSNRKYILTEYKDREAAFYFEDDTLTQIYLSDQKEYNIGDIFVGKIKNIVPGIGAAFVEFSKGNRGFLPLNNITDLSLITKQQVSQLKNEDELLVQVVKEPIKTKDAQLSTDITFSGQYFVLMPFSKGIHYSLKFTKEQKEELWTRMTDIVSMLFGDLEVFLKKYGLIVRTNAYTCEDEVLFQELHDLFHKACYVVSVKDKRTAFSRVYEELPFYEKILKDAYNVAEADFITDLPDVYEILLKHNIQKARYYRDTSVSLSCLYNLESSMNTLLEKKVWLKSGGYLIIEYTEAMTVIDVNSGKCNPGKNSDIIYTKINQEAAYEIARQLRLRNLSGIIIIDFVNMVKEEDRQNIISILKKEFKKDNVETCFIDYTALGLVEITRKKISAPLHEKIN